MSTILNTLKKLEEEKSVLEKNIDLKGLLLQGQEAAYPQMERHAPRKWSLLGGLIFGVGLIVGLAVYFLQVPEPVSLSQDDSYAFNNSPAKPGVKKLPEKVGGNPGIPLAGIPETTPGVLDDPMMDTDFFVPESAIPLEDMRLLSAAEESEPEGYADVREIENLIQTATAPQEDQDQSLENQVSALSGSRHIPGLKLKGIIFFSPGNPANHVFVATDGDTSMKLKVGDSLQGVTLEAIEAQKAVFSNGGELMDIPIGE